MHTYIGKAEGVIGVATRVPYKLFPINYVYVQDFFLELSNVHHYWHWRNLIFVFNSATGIRICSTHVWENVVMIQSSK